MPASAIAHGLRRVGAGTRRAVSRLGFAARFAFAVLTHSPEGIRRLRLTLREIYFSGVLSLVIILVSGLFVGMVLGLQGYDTLQRFGSEARAFFSKTGADSGCVSPMTTGMPGLMMPAFSPAISGRVSPSRF